MKESGAFINDALTKLRRPFVGKERLAIITLLLAVFPLLLVLGSLSYACEAAIYLGHWPSYNNPDPKQLPGWFAIQHDALGVGLLASEAIFCLAIGLAIVGRICSREFPLAWMILVAAVSVGLALVYVHFDPGGVLSWFFD